MSVLDRIRAIDARLLLAGERLARYRDTGSTDSVIVQRGRVRPTARRPPGPHAGTRQALTP